MCDSELLVTDNNNRTGCGRHTNKTQRIHTRANNVGVLRNNYTKSAYYTQFVAYKGNRFAYVRRCAKTSSLRRSIVHTTHHHKKRRHRSARMTVDSLRTIATSTQTPMPKWQSDIFHLLRVQLIAAAQIAKLATRTDNLCTCNFHTSTQFLDAASRR